MIKKPSYFFNRNFILFFYFFCCVTPVFAQKQGAIWYFGSNAGLDFNTGNPVALTNGALVSSEGCASISDRHGNIRFYTNGETVWNKNNVPMANGTGLFGNSAATQSALIVNQPGNNDLFYLFTVTQLGGDTGLNYSIVDMSLNNGLGDVTNKNTPLLPGTNFAEKITAVQSADNSTFWIIAHEMGNAIFDVFPLSSSGINSPNQYLVGTKYNSEGCSAMGYLKASPDGSKIASAVAYCLDPSTRARIEVFDFNNATGTITQSSDYVLDYVSGAFGVEFSPNNRYLYVSEWYSGEKLIQYDLQADSVLASKIIVGTTIVSGYDAGTNCFGALQLGLDGRIYVAKNFKKKIGVIKYPNQRGYACGFVDDTIDLGGKTAQLGLPNLINANLINPTIVSTDTAAGGCLQDTTSKINFAISATGGIENVIWNFGDHTAQDTGFSVNHAFPKQGKYPIKAYILFSDSTIDTLSSACIIKQGPLYPKNLQISYALCQPGDTVTLDGTSGPAGVTYLWQSNGKTVSTNSVLKVFQADTLNYTATFNGCQVNTIVPVANFKINLGHDTTICIGDSIILSSGLPDGGIYIWYFQGKIISTNPTVKVGNAGTYKLIAVIGNCSGVAQINIKFRNKVKPQIKVTANRNLICAGDTTALHASKISGSGISTTYTWYEFDFPIYSGPDSVIAVSGAGIYTCKINIDGCPGFDSVDVYSPKVSIPSPTYLCSTPEYFYGTIYLYPFDPNGIAPVSSTPISYSWDSAGIQVSNKDILQVNQLATYTFSASGYGCSFADTLVVLPKPAPLTFPLLPLPSVNDTSLCSDYRPFILDATDPVAVSYTWVDLSNSKTQITPQYEITEFGDYRVTAYNGCESLSKEFDVSVRHPISAYLKPITYVCPGTGIISSLTPDTYNEGAQYVWKDSTGKIVLQGNQTQAAILTTTVPGLYSLTISDPCQVKTQSTDVVFFTAFTVASLGNDTGFCAGDSIILNPILTPAQPTHEITFNWFKNGVLIDTNESLIVKTSGTYRIKSFNGCFFSEDSIVVTVDSVISPVPIQSHYATCSDSIKIDVRTSNLVNKGAVYIWTDSLNNVLLKGSESTAGVISFSKPGTYKLSVTNACQTKQYTTSISFSTPLQVKLGNDTGICQGKSLVLTPVVTPAQTGVTFKWYEKGNQVSSGAIYTLNSAGTFTVKADNGCFSSEDSITITVNQLLAPVSLNAHYYTCPGNFQINVQSNSNPGALYVWSDSLGNTLLKGTDSTAGIVSITSAGTYVLTASNSCGINTYHTEVSYSQPFTVSLGADTGFCQGQNKKIIPVLSPSQPNANYKWYKNGLLVDSSSQYNIQDSATYLVSVNNGCYTETSQKKVTFGALLAPVALYSDYYTCPGDTTINVITSNNANAGAYYVWTNGLGDTVLQGTELSAGKITLSNAGTYRLTISNTCQVKSYTTTLSYLSPFDVELGSSSSICEGDTFKTAAKLIPLQPNPKISYKWYKNGIPADTTLNINIFLSGNYTLAVNNGCYQNKDSLQINVNPVPQVRITGDSVLCEGTTPLSAQVLYPDKTVPIGYLWDNNQVSDSSRIQASVGTHQVIVTAKGCNDSASFVINETQPPVSITFDKNPAYLCTQDSLKLDFTNKQLPGLKYAWFESPNVFIDSNTKITIKQSGLYYLQIRNTCKLINDTLTVFVKNCLQLTPGLPFECDGFFIPNVITPNEDGINDAFSFGCFVQSNQWKLLITNRWGRIIYQSDNYKNDWDASDVPPGVYFYSIVSPITQHNYKGFVEILK